MKAEKWVSMLWASVIAFVIAFGGAGCIATGMRLAMVDMRQVALICALSAIVFAVCCRVRLGLLPLCAAALLVGYLWQSGPLNRSMEALLYQISTLYDRGYGWGVIRWSTAGRPSGTATLALGLCCAAIAGVFAATVAGKHRLSISMAISFLPLLVCVVLTDTVPDGKYLFCLFFGMILALLTQTVRLRDHRRGNVLSAALVIPVALALGVLFLAIPQEGYDRQSGAQKLEELVSEWFDITIEETPGLPSRPAWVGNNGDLDMSYVDLAGTGPQSSLNTGVLHITATTSGRIYLRGNAYDVYNGTSWNATQGEWPRDSYYPVRTAWKSGQALLEFRDRHSVKYFTYNPAEAVTMTQGRVENTYALDTYTVRYLVQPDDFIAQSSRPLIYHEPQELAQYLQLPETTAAAATQILGKINSGNTANAWLYACDIAEYVKNSAEYDLRTAKMPGRQQDFAIWFLENSDSGYCVHFATAAAVLLRAAGIPARYVTGYMVDVQADVREAVGVKDAHAWVECYIGGAGWVVLEATPGGNSTSVPETTPDGTEPPPETQPNEQTDPDSPSQLPSDPDEPTDQQDPAAEEKQSDPIWSVLLWIVASLAAVVTQWQVRLWLKRQRQRRGTPNASALAKWREVERISRLLKQPVDKELHELAQKAKFSQHSLTAAELLRFDGWISHNKMLLRQKPVWNQLVYTLILAIY